MEEEEKGGIVFAGLDEDSFAFLECKRVNNCDKRKVIKTLIKKNRVDLVCLQETKIQEMSRGLVHSLGVGRFLE